MSTRISEFSERRVVSATPREVIINATWLSRRLAFQCDALDACTRIIELTVLVSGRAVEREAHQLHAVRGADPSPERFGVGSGASADIDCAEVFFSTAISYTFGKLILNVILTQDF